MSFSVGNLIHRAIVFGAIGFGAYGTVVIGQNLYVKSQRIKEAQQTGQEAEHELATGPLRPASGQQQPPQ